MSVPLAGVTRAHRIAAALHTTARLLGVGAGWSIEVPGVRVRVHPDGAVDVRTRRGTAVLSGELGDPARVAALVGAEADVAGLVAERFRVTPVRRR